MSKENQTFEADTGQPVNPQPIPQSPNWQVPSMVKIPPQIATTLCWVALGFGIALWLEHRRNSKGQRNYRES